MYQFQGNMPDLGSHSTLPINKEVSHQRRSSHQHIDPYRAHRANTVSHTGSARGPYDRESSPVYANLPSQSHAHLPDESGFPQPIWDPGLNTTTSFLENGDQNGLHHGQDLSEAFPGCRPKIVTGALTIALSEDELLLNSTKSYHGNISTEGAAHRLEKFKDHCYLTRWSNGNHCYVLTVYSKSNPLQDRVTNFEIKFNIAEKIFKINGKNKEFHNFDEMLEHYERNQIHPSFQSIGTCLTEQDWKRIEELVKEPPDGIGSAQHRDLETTLESEGATCLSQFAAIPGEKILPPHDSYHSSITEREATRRLKKFQDHCYLIYYNEEYKCYMLLVYSKQNPSDRRTKNFAIEVFMKQERKKFKIKGKSEEFDDVGAMLAHYEQDQNQIDPRFPSIGTRLTKQYWENNITGCTLL